VRLAAPEFGDYGLCAKNQGSGFVCKQVPKGSNMLSYKRLSSATAAIALALSLVLLLAPELILRLFQIQGSESAFFISRRAAMLFLGMAVMSWIGRNALDSDSRQAICLGLSVTMFTLAALGLFEYFRGYVGLGIFLAVVTELGLGVGYIQLWRSNRTT
jgi:hypothetical protein